MERVHQMDPRSILVFTLHVFSFPASHADGYCQVIYSRIAYNNGTVVLIPMPIESLWFCILQRTCIMHSINALGTKTNAIGLDHLPQDGFPLDVELSHFVCSIPHGL